MNTGYSLADQIVAIVLWACFYEGRSRMAVFARPIRQLFPRVTIALRRLGGMKVDIQLGNQADLVIFEEIFIGNVYPFSLMSFVPDAVVDCGGFAGYFTLLAAAEYPLAKLIVFEPNSMNYRRMRKNFELNRLSVDSRREAVSNAAGLRRFHENGCGSRLEGDESGASSVAVQAIRLSEFVGNLQSERILLKLDVEGEEKVILPDLIPRLPQRCALFVEWHHRERDFAEVEEQLRSEGFFVKRCRSRFQGYEDFVYLDVFALRDAESDSASR